LLILSTFSYLFSFIYQPLILSRHSMFLLASFLRSKSCLRTPLAHGQVRAWWPSFTESRFREAVVLSPSLGARTSLRMVSPFLSKAQMLNLTVMMKKKKDSTVPVQVPPARTVLRRATPHVRWRCGPDTFGGGTDQSVSMWMVL
jgi:hypothetical protein